MQINRRHKVGLFLTTVIVGAALLLDVSAKESVGIALLGLAATWLVGNVRLREQESSHHDRQQLPETPPVVDAPEQVVAPSEGGGKELEKSVVPTKPRGSWAWVVISSMSFSVLLSLAIFNLTWQSIVGESEKAGESLGRMLIPLIILGFAARNAWKSLLAKEPGDNPVYQLRHRRFNVIDGICAIALLSFAVGFGTLSGDRIQRNRRMDATVSEIAKLGPKGAELRGQIKAVLSQDTPTFADYYLRCLKLEKVLDEYDLQQQRLRPLLNTILAEAGDQPKLAEIAGTVQRINDKDAEVVKLFRLEIAKGKEVISLPPSQQSSFYRNEVMPLEREATKVAEEEIAMMREAEQKGMKWPADVKELLSNANKTDGGWPGAQHAVSAWGTFDFPPPLTPAPPITSKFASTLS
jgi:hypothetical protein